MRSIAVSMAMVVSLTLTAAGQSSSGGHLVSGVVTKVDDAAKTVAIKTSDGVEVAATETAKTVKHGAKGAVKGGHAIVDYTADGAKSTAHAVKYVGDKTVHAADVTVVKVDKGTKTFAVKTARGTEDVFHVAGDGVIIASTDTAHGTADVFEYLGSAAKSGAKVTVHYTDEAGKKVAHAFKHL